MIVTQTAAATQHKQRGTQLQDLRFIDLSESVRAKEQQKRITFTTIVLLLGFHKSQADSILLNKSIPSDVGSVSVPRFPRFYNTTGAVSLGL